MFIVWPIETTPNAPSPIFWLEMVTTSENNSVCEGKMTIFASFLLTDFFNMVDRTDPCALVIHRVLCLKWCSPPWLFSLPLEIPFSFYFYYSFFSFSTFSSLFWSKHLKDTSFSLKERGKNTRTGKNQTQICFMLCNYDIHK